MDVFANLWSGLLVVLKFAPVDLAPGAYSFIIPLPVNILLCLIGVMIGTLIGVLPGVGPSRPSRCCCRSPTSSTRPAR